MKTDKEKLSNFVELIENSIPESYKNWVEAFQITYKRKPILEEFYENDIKHLGFVHYGGPPLSEKETENREVSISAQIHKRLKELYTEKEITELICNSLKNLDRNKTPVYVLTIVYLIAERLEKNEEVFRALCESTFQFKDIIGCELLYGILKRHATSKEIVNFAINLLKSEEYRQRDIANGLLYCTSYVIKGDLVTPVLTAYKIAYNYELKSRTKSPYSEQKERYLKKINEFSKIIEEQNS